VVSQVGAMDPGQILRDQTTPEQFAALQKVLLELEGGHYSVYRGSGADEASRAAVDWFTTHLVQS
jgi:hypothetical protein